MHVHSSSVLAPPYLGAELDRLGDEIAESCPRTSTPLPRACSS